MEKHRYLLDSLRDWLHGRGFVDAASNGLEIGHLQPDLVVRKDDRLLIAEAKVANVYRSQVFPALVGDLILRAKDAGDEADVLIALLVKRMSDKAVIDLGLYAEDFLPGLNWFLLDESGVGMARMDGMDVALSLDPLPQDASSKKRGAPARSLFSLNNQWLLKMLLLPGIDPKYWGGPRQRPGSIVSLAKESHVPQPSVSSFISKFEDEKYIRRDKGMPVVVRHRELLDEWFYAGKHAASERIPVKHMYGDSPEAFIQHLGDENLPNDEPDMIVGFHLACHLLGIGRSNVKVGWAYSRGSSDSMMRKYDLVEDESSSPSFWLVPGQAKAVRSSWVSVQGVPVCDVLQCYLDVRESQARGQEQADYILNEILMPHFEGRS